MQNKKNVRGHSHFPFQQMICRKNMLINIYRGRAPVIMRTYIVESVNAPSPQLIQLIKEIVMLPGTCNPYLFIIYNSNYLDQYLFENLIIITSLN